MAKNTTKSISSAATDSVVTGPQNGAAVVDEVNASSTTDANSAGAVGKSVPAAIYTPESESGDAAGAGSSAPVKPQEGISPTDAIPAKAEAAPSTPEAEALASGDNSGGSSQGAADDDGSMAGPVRALVIEAGATNVAELLVFANLGKRVFKAFSDQGFDALEWINAYEAGVPAWLNGVDLPTMPATANITVDKDGKVSAGSIRVKSARDGFRRAGFVHSKAGRTFAPDELTEEQLEALETDPTITVEYL